MSVLVVGSVALDAVETPFGKADDVIGGSAVFFAAAACAFGPVQVVGVVGDDYPLDDLAFLREKGVDFSGVETAHGESFRWAGVYSYDLNSRETLETRLGVFADFSPKIPEPSPAGPGGVPGQHRPRASARRPRAGPGSEARGLRQR